MPGSHLFVAWHITFLECSPSLSSQKSSFPVDFWGSSFHPDASGFPAPNVSEDHKSPLPNLHCSSQQPSEIPLWNMKLYKEKLLHCKHLAFSAIHLIQTSQFSTHSACCSAISQCYKGFMCNVGICISAPHLQHLVLWSWWADHIFHTHEGLFEFVYLDKEREHWLKLAPMNKNPWLEKSDLAKGKVLWPCELDLLTWVLFKLSFLCHSIILFVMVASLSRLRFFSSASFLRHRHRLYFSY